MKPNAAEKIILKHDPLYMTYNHKKNLKKIAKWFENGRGRTKTDLARAQVCRNAKATEKLELVLSQLHIV